MDWLDNQIEERERNDSQMLEESIRAISDAITGKIHNGEVDYATQARSALDAVLRYYGSSLPDNIEASKDLDIAHVIDDDIASTGIMARPVRLTQGWQKDAAGAFLGFLADDTPVALIPCMRGGYSMRSPKTGSVEHVTEKTLSQLKETAYCFYRPLPQRKLHLVDLGVFTARLLDRSDYVVIFGATLLSTLLGMVSPVVNQIVFGPVVESGTTSIIFPITALLLGMSVSQLLLGTMKSLVMSRISIKLDIPLQAAIMMRVLSLPATFFTQYETGALSARISSVATISLTLQNLVLSTALSSLFSFAYLFQIGNIAPALLLPALAVIIVTTAFSIIVTLVSQRITRTQLKLSSDLSGMQYAMLSGIQKIKLAGAESRAFAKWGTSYAEVARLTYNSPAILRLSSVISTAISSIGTLVIYSSAIAGGVSVAEYMAFTSAYGMVSGAFSSLTSSALQISQIKPNLEMAKPIMDAIPESAQGRQRIERVSGGFELDHVTFSYPGSNRTVLNDLSLKVKPGSYVAIVGKTGCGKSTLMRLLLGFETPQSGAIYYDGRDLSRLDARGLRRNIGVVLQNGKLFSGSIYDNIAISAPGLSKDDAWHAAELAGVADDIRAMPMGMQTMISEGGGGISGGQRQRLMIARALAPKPKILMFDEATSALDNITQRTVSESLDSLDCTRLVIAHRLSTIRECDRIVVLDNGQIAEDGTYDDLVKAGGLFAELVKRQQL